MKKITICLTLILLVFQGYSQVSLGDGTLTNKHVPFEPSFSYSYAQSIYLASEISASGDITSLQWYFNGNSLDYSAITVYLGHTSKSEFSTNEDWETADNLVQAYSGPITANGPGWVTIDLQLPFAYNGTDNLVVAVKETLIGADPNNADFLAYEVPTRRSLSSYGDDPFDPEFPPYADYRGSYVPNVILGSIIQICPFPVNISVSDITTSSLLLAWETAGAIPSGGSEYYISDSNTNPTVLTAPTGSVASGNSAEITTGLNPGTVYKVWVRDVCEGTPGNWSPPVSFVTACLPIASFNENFDGTDSGLPICWSSIIRGSTIDLSPGAHVDIVNWDGHSGSNSVEFYKDYPTTNDDLILVSPAINAIATHRVKFFAKTNANSSHLIIGTLDGNTADANFAQFFDEIEITPNYAEYTVEFTEYEGTDSHIGFRMQDNTGYASIYMDDIRWELIPPCPDVANIEVPFTTPSTATVTWGAAGQTEWKVVYAPSDVQNPDGLTPVTVLANATKTIEGLSENTSYNVWVSSVCTEGQGLWTGPVTFTTACTAINQFHENFDTVEAPELPSCWTKIIRGNTVGEDAYVRTEASDLYSSPTAVVMNSGFSTGADDVILVSPNLGDIQAIPHRLKFFAKHENGIGALQVGTLSSNTANADFTFFQDVITTDDATHYTVDFSAYEGTDTYVGIRLGNGELIKYSIDDIEWDVTPSCPDPSDLSVSALSSSSVTLQWVAGGSESQWEIVYAPAATLYPEALTPSNLLTSPTLTIGSLSDNTSYKAWVRSVCSGSNGDWVGPLTFTTPCIPVTYLNENFDSVTAPALPGCWSSILRGQELSPYAEVSTVDYYLSPSLSNSIKISNSGSAITDEIILVSPQLSNLPNGTHRLKFYAKKVADAGIQIGTLNNNTSEATFTDFTNVVLTNNYVLYTVDFTTYAGTDTYIGMRINPAEASYASIYIDDVIWETAPLCPDLAGLAVTATTVSTADITWSGGNGTSQAQVVYGAVSVNDPATLVPGPLLSTTSTQLTDLQSNTTYRFWVRSVCTAPGGDGAWIGPVEFSTKCLSGSVPYTENFEGLLAPNLPNCSSFLHEGIGNNWNTSDDPYGDFETICLTYGGSNVAANAWFFTQGLNLMQGTDYKIAFDYGKSGFDTTESLKVMYGTSADVAGMTLPLVDLPEITNTLPVNNSISFTAPTTGVYYFGFNAYSTAQQDLLIVDNISVDFMLSNGGFLEENFSYYPNPVKNTLNLSYAKNISKVTIYNILGQKVIDNLINTNNTQVDMSPLSRGTYIVKVTSEDQTKTIKVVKE